MRRDHLRHAVAAAAGLGPVPTGHYLALARPGRPYWISHDRHASSSLDRRGWVVTAPAIRLRRLLGRTGSRPATARRWHSSLSAQLDTAPRRTATWAACAAATLAGLGFGPVAAAIAGCYTAMAVLAHSRHRREAVTRRRRTAARQSIATLAADLRAGADTTTALAEAHAQLGGSAPPSPSGAGTVGRPADTRSAELNRATPADTTRSEPPVGDRVCRRIRDRLDTAVHIAETTGAPIADLLDRLAADLRATDRVEATLSTHTAGSHASSRLLAALPIAGLGLGQTLGTDPITTLLHTPLGAACALTALALQLTGLAWSRRILASATGGPA